MKCWTCDWEIVDSVSTDVPFECNPTEVVQTVAPPSNIICYPLEENRHAA